jgi:hypothetical protein
MNENNIQLKKIKAPKINIKSVRMSTEDDKKLLYNSSSGITNFQTYNSSIKQDPTNDFSKEGVNNSDKQSTFSLIFRLYSF